MFSIAGTNVDKPSGFSCPTVTGHRVHGMEHLERLWILPDLFPHIFCWPFEGCWVLSTGSAPQDMAMEGTVSSLPQGDCLVSHHTARHQFPVIGYNNTAPVQKQPALALPLKEFKPVMKIRGETFSRMSLAKHFCSRQLLVPLGRALSACRAGVC